MVCLTILSLLRPTTATAYLEQLIETKDGMIKGLEEWNAKLVARVNEQDIQVKQGLICQTQLTNKDVTIKGLEDWKDNLVKRVDDQEDQIWNLNEVIDRLTQCGSK